MSQEKGSANVTAFNTFTFQGFTMRPVRACLTVRHNDQKDAHCRSCSDLKLARAWTTADPYHQGVSPFFWLEQRPGVESYMMEDHGGPLFFFKLVRTETAAIEIHIQFQPEPAESELRLAHRERVQSALLLGLEWLERVLAPRGIVALCFVSRSPSLIRFSTACLGFQRQPFELGGDAVLIKRIAKSSPVSI